MNSQSPNLKVIIIHGDSPLHVAVRQGQIEEVRKILIQQQVDVNIPNAKHETPLHLACSQRDSAMVQLLIAFGADPYIEDSNDNIAYRRCGIDIGTLMNTLLYRRGLWISGPIQTDGDTQLHIAVRLGMLDDVQRMIDEQCIGINDTNTNHETPLHLSCVYGHKCIVHVLISNGADMYIRDCHNNAPIHRAVSQGHADIMDYLITDCTCDPKIKGYQSRTLLHFASAIGNANLVNKLIEKHGISPVATDAVNQTPLHIAASHGQEGVVRLLITNYNCPVNCRSNYKLSPLHLAAYCSHEPVIKTLLEYEADLNALDEEGSVPFIKAAVGGNLKLVQMMITEFNQDPLSITDDSGNTPLHMACWGGHEELARLLITKYNCPVDVKNKNNEIPLHSACLSGHISVVRMLSKVLGNDSCVCAIDNDNSSPLHLAALNGHTSMIRTLIKEFDYNSHIKGAEGKSLLHYACNGGMIELATTLITDFNLGIMLVDDNGDTALHISCLHGHVELARLLITKYNCPVDVINKNKRTPLHNACLYGHCPVVRMLVSEFKANLMARDHEDNTPINKAAQGGHEDVVKMLIIEFGCDKNVKGFEGRSLLHQACRKGHTKLAVILMENFKLCHLRLSVDNRGDTILHMTYWGDHAVLARLLITKYVCPFDVQNKSNQTPLHIACFCGHLCVSEVVASEYLQCATNQVLLNTDCNTLDKDDNTPLNLAIISGNAKAVHILSKKYGCKPHFKGVESKPLLHHLTKRGFATILQELICKFSHDPATVDKQGNTLLHIAAHQGCYDIVANHINHCPINNKNSLGQTALHCACVKGHTRVAKLLVEKGASVTIKDKSGCTPLQKAFSQKHLDTFFKIFDSDVHEINFVLLHQVCKRGSVDLVEILLSDHNIDPSSVLDSQGNQALHIAAIKGHKKLIMLLIEKYKCNVDVKNFNEQTPLHLLCSQVLTPNIYTIINLFVFNFSADVNSKDKIGQTPLHLLCSQPPTEYSESLINHFVTNLKADVTARDKNGQTPLHLLCSLTATKNTEAFVKLLVNVCKADTNSVDKSGQTPFHLLFSQTPTEYTEALIKLFITKFRADVTFRNKMRQTPLHMLCSQAANKNTEALVKQFFKHDVTSRDKNGQTPLHLLCSQRPTESTFILFKLFITEFKADVNSRDINGQTPLHLLCLQAPSEIVDAIIKNIMFITEFKADVTSRNKMGDQPIHLTAQAGGTSAVINLIELSTNTDQNSRGFKRWTLLHHALAKGHTSTAKTLIDDFHLSLHCIDDDGNTPLHLSSLYGQPKSIRFLLYEYHAPVYVRNKAGKRALDLAKDESTKNIIREYVKSKHKSIQQEYDELRIKSLQKYSGQQIVTRLFVLGNSGSGKSTLIESLKRKGIISSLFPVTEADVPLHTAGIVPSVHQSKETGRLIYYDFAGDKEYYSSHAAVLEMVSHSAVGSNIYLIIIDLRKAIETIFNEVGYWLSFISYNSNTLTNKCILKVIIILSHSDCVSLIDSSGKVEETKEYLDTHMNQSNEVMFEIVGVISSNCRSPRSSKSIESILQQTCTNVMPHSITYEASLLYGILEKEFGNVVTCKFQDLLSCIKDTGIYLPTSADALYPIVKELHDISLLMMIGKSKDQVENHLILMDVPSLTNEVHEKLFSKSAKQKLSGGIESQYIRMGIFPESFISSILPHHITKECLVQLQYCQEFSHADVGLDNSVTQNYESNDILLYFPALCQLESEHATWPHDPNLNFSIGWFVKCSGKLDYFPPRYLHVLLLRLTFMFALPASTTPTSDLDLSLCLQGQNCHCNMWKKGIHWLMKDGVECIVEVVNESRGVVVVVKSRKQHIYQCIHILTVIANVVTEAKTEFCNSVTLQHYILNSNDPSSYSNVGILYDVNMIKSAMENKDEIVISVSGHQTLSLESLKFIKCHTCWGKCSSILF